MSLYEIILIFCALAPVVSIVLTSLKTGISPMPSSRKARRVILDNAKVAKDGSIVDLGSGWGTLAIDFAKKYPDHQVIGYELSFFPWFFSLLLKHFLGLRNLSLLRKDFLQEDLSNASPLICYLFPGGMQALEKKLLKEAKGEIRIISNTFALPSHQPENVIHADDMHNSPIYFYTYKAGN